MKPPMQPVIRAKDGCIRFQKNEVVAFLLDWARERGMDLNELALGGFPDEDRAQLAQLIGSSITGFHQLPYVSDEMAAAASAEARKINPEAGGCRDGDGCPFHSQSYR